MTRSKVPAVVAVLVVGLMTATRFSPVSQTVTAADTNAYFDALITRPGFWKGYSFRPKPGFGPESPYFTNQLEYKKDGGYQVSSSAPRYVTYDPTMNAAKVVIPAWVQPGFSLVLGANMGSSDARFYPATWTGSFGAVGRQVKIDGEIMLITGVDPDGTSPRGVIVSRGQYGTKAIGHAAGAAVYLGNNSLPHQVRVPLDTADGNTYVFTWDVLYTSSYLNTGLAGNKTFQFSSGTDGIWWEVKTRMDGGSQISIPSGFNKSVHVGGLDVRSYNKVGGDSNWLLTDGAFLGPGVTGNQPVNPMQSTFILHPNRWIRYWVVVEQRANDYDYIDMWAADELQGPTMIYKRIPASTYSKGVHTINKFWIEFNDSAARLPAGRTTDFRDLVAYVRNFAALRNIGDVSPLLQRPVPGVLPGPTVAGPGAPQNVRILN
jgi:hypothetical protein